MRNKKEYFGDGKMLLDDEGQNCHQNIFIAQGIMDGWEKWMAL
jgi:hypothetical protein